MKKLLLFICTTLMIASVNGQEKNTPFKKANTIIIKAPSKDSLLNKLAVLLAQNGYGIENKDVSTGIINTTERSPKRSDVVVKIVGIVSDSTITLRGQFKMTMSFSIGGVSSVPAYEDIRFGGMKGSPTRDAWNELNTIATKIGSSDILYTIN